MSFFGDAAGSAAADEATKGGSKGKAPAKKGNDWHGIPIYVWAIGGVALAYLLYRWYENRKSTASTASTTPPSSTTGTGSGQYGGGGGGYGGGGWGANQGSGSVAGGSGATSSVGTGSLVSTGTATSSFPNPSGTVVPAVTGASGSSTSSLSPGNLGNPGGLPQNLQPVGLSGVNYNPSPSTPNQVVVGSAGGLTTISLPAGENLSTPVTVPNTSAGNPTVPLSDTISTGSANTLSSAYGNAQTASSLVGQTSVTPAQQAQAAAQVAAASNTYIPVGTTGTVVNAPIYGAVNSQPTTAPTAQVAKVTNNVAPTPEAAAAKSNSAGSTVSGVHAYPG